MTQEPATEAPLPQSGQYYYGTGRRKCAVARTRLYPGSGGHQRAGSNITRSNGHESPSTDIDCTRADGYAKTSGQGEHNH